jgi:hypothetical protein
MTANEDPDNVALIQEPHMTANEDPEYVALIAEAMRHASAFTCRCMADFFERAAEESHINDETRAHLLGEAKRWRDAAAAKTEPADGQEPTG